MKRRVLITIIVTVVLSTIVNLTILLYVISVIRYDKIGTGSVARTFYKKLVDTVSVKDFGAVGDAVTDDAKAIQAALDAVGASGGGGVYVPSGIYYVSAGLVIPSYVNFYGEGIGNTIIRNPARIKCGETNVGNVCASIGSVGATHISISKITVDHATYNTNSNGIALIPAGESGPNIPTGMHTTYATIENVEILGSNTHQYLIWSHGADHVKILNNFIDGGVQINDASSSQDGIEIYGGTDVLVQGNTVRNIGSTAIWTFSDNTAHSTRDGVRVVDNYIDCSRYGIGGRNASTATHIYYKRNIVKNSWVVGIAFSADSGVILNDIQISGNSVSDVGEHGISVNTNSHPNVGIVKNIIVSGNTIQRATLNGLQLVNISNARVNDNMINNANQGIFVISTASSGKNISITNNSVNNIQQHAIRLYDVGPVEVKNNILTKYNLDNGNYYGIYLEAPQNVSITDNEFLFGGKTETYAVYSDGTDDDLSIFHNILKYRPTLAEPFKTANTRSSSVFYIGEGKSKNINVSTNYVAGFYQNIICNHAETPFTVILPTASGINMGQRYTIKNIGTAVVTVSGAIDGDSGKSLAQYKYITVVSGLSEGTTYKWFIVAGNL